MKIKIILGLLLLYNLSISQIQDSINAFTSSDSIAQKIIEKYITAIGGREKLESINNKTTKLRSTVEGMNFTLTIIQKAPDKLFQELEFTVGKQITVFNGEKGKIEGMGQIQILEGEPFEELKYLAKFNSFLDYKKNSIDFEFGGIDTVNGNEANKIILNAPNGKFITDYYDIDSGYKIREETNISTSQGSFKQILELNDYRSVDGIMNPFKLTQKTNGREIELVVESIEYNTDIDDSIFEVE